jgi:hypothetical protein
VELKFSDGFVMKKNKFSHLLFIKVWYIVVNTDRGSLLIDSFNALGYFILGPNQSFPRLESTQKMNILESGKLLSH